MTTELRRRTTTTSPVLDNDSSPSISDVSMAFHRIGNAVKETAQLTNTVILEFHGILKNILPLFSGEHQKQIRDIFIDYHKFLIQSQRLLTRALILAPRARTVNELVESINIKIIEDMLSTVIVLLEKFCDLDPIVKEKLRDHRALEQWRNIFGLMTSIGLAAFGIGFGIGSFAVTGFTNAMRVYLITTGSITVSTGCATAAFHMAQKISDINLLIENLK